MYYNIKIRFLRATVPKMASNRGFRYVKLEVLLSVFTGFPRFLRSFIKFSLLKKSICPLVLYVSFVWFYLNMKYEETVIKVGFLCLVFSGCTPAQLQLHLHNGCLFTLLKSSAPK